MLNLNRLGSPFKPGEALTKKKQPPSGKKLSETEMNSQRFHKVFTSLFPNSQKIKEKHTYTLDSEIRQCIENLKQKVEEKDVPITFEDGELHQIEDLYKLFSQIVNTTAGKSFKQTKNDLTHFNVFQILGYLDKETLGLVESFIENVDKVKATHPVTKAMLKKIREDTRFLEPDQRPSFRAPSERILRGQQAAMVRRISTKEISNFTGFEKISIPNITPSLIGKNFADYTIISGSEIFGEGKDNLNGTNGHVYLAQLTSDAKNQVIIKIIPSNIKGEDIMRECNAQNTIFEHLSSSNASASKVHKIFEDPKSNCHAIIMDVAKGSPVKTKLDEASYSKYKNQLIEVLTTALSRYDKSHFDIKPDNLIWSDEDRKLTLIDFGNSYTNNSTDLQSKIQNIGSKGFIAPILTNFQHPNYFESFAAAITLAYALFDPKDIPENISDKSNDLRNAKETELGLIGKNTQIDGKSKTNDTMVAWLEFFETVKSDSNDQFTTFQKKEALYLAGLLKRDEYINSISPATDTIMSTDELLNRIKGAQSPPRTP